MMYFLNVLLQDSTVEICQTTSTDSVSSNTPPCLSVYDQTYLSAAYARKSSRCSKCSFAILPQHVKVGLVRLVVTARYPCFKSHWCHPACIDATELNIIHRFGSYQGKYHDLTPSSPLHGMTDLSAPHQVLLRRLIECWCKSHSAVSAEELKDFPEEFLEVGKWMKGSNKRKSKDTDDAEYLPKNARDDMSSKRRFSGACRSAVSNAVNAFKEKYFRENADGCGRVTCAVSGKLITPSEAHVDHAPPFPFDAMVESFLTKYGHTHHMSRLQVLSRTEYVAGRFFDHLMAEEFRTYHSTNATLRVLAASTNLKLPRPATKHLEI